tara:strand:+ start:24268 stop:26577 length:2310 start_codon:yes stop_codon:yes gene_type:complete
MKYKNPYIKITWEDTPENFTQEKIKRVKNYFRKKYNSERVNLVTKIQGFDSKENNNITTDNIVDAAYQRTLIKEFLEEQGVKVDWDKIIRLDNKIEEKIESNELGRNKKWYIKWIEFNNFLSFGENNKIDFNKYNGLTGIDSQPSNFGGKTTLTVDLLLFLFFNTTTKSSKAIDIFNKFTDMNRVLVMGEVEIDGEDYIIERGVIRRLTKKGDWSVRTELNFSKRLADGSLQNLQGEQRRETEEFIKNSIGTMDDFLLTILATANNLEDLIEAKPTQRGQILTRFIGLEHLRKKEETCKEIYSAWSKRLISNVYDVVTLEGENEEIEVSVKELVEEIEKEEKSLKEFNKNIEELDLEKETLLTKRHNINPELTVLNPTTLTQEIESLEKKYEETVTKGKEIKNLKPLEIFNEKEHKKLETLLQNNKVNYQVQTNTTQTLEKLIKTLEESEVCPTCKRRLDDIDHTKEIEDKKSELISHKENLKILKEGIDTNIVELDEHQLIKTKWEDFERNKLRAAKNKLEVEQLELDIRVRKQRLNEWEENKKKLEENKIIETKLLRLKTTLETENAKKNNSSYTIQSNKIQIVTNNRKVEENNTRIKEIKKEEEVDKIFKAYLIAFGKNGISKLVLRNTIPYLNNELNRLLVDSCEFTLHLKINDRNELEFWMIDNLTSVEKLMSSGSGYEKTVASLALRAVLAKVCALPQPNVVCFDEAFGKVSDENLDLMGKFFVKIKDYFERIFVISHNPLIKEWCDQTITVKKEKNISKLID